MTTLNAYLRHKHDAFHAPTALAAAPGYEVRDAVECACPILNLLRRPQAISGEVTRADDTATTHPIPSAVGG